MKVKKRSQKVDLIPAKNSNVILTITIGNAQIGASVIRIKGTQEILGKGDIRKCNLGIGGALVNKTLLVTTNILDSNQQTNGVVVTYFFESCQPQAIMFHDNVDHDGDIFSFLVEFTFK